MESEEEVLRRIGERIKMLRKEAGYTSYEDFCWEHGFNRKQYWMLESGKTNPTVKTLLRIAQIHGIGLEDLLRNEGEEDQGS